MLPYEPVEGQLIALQHRLLRQSRAMLDPMLNLGLTDVATARRILEEDGFSPAMVKQEVDRYTFRAPGQAGSYFYGYSQLADLRVATELALGAKFDRLAFNDFIVGQGLLPLGPAGEGGARGVRPRAEEEIDYNVLVAPPSMSMTAPCR